MNLTDIAGITGQKSVSDMTDEELREHLRLIRKSRMETKQSDRRMTEKPDAVEGYEKPKRAKAAKKKKEPTLMSLDKLSPEEAQALLALLGE